jgi:hypothetical protein
MLKTRGAGTKCSLDSKMLSLELERAKFANNNY